MMCDAPSITWDVSEGENSGGMERTSTCFLRCPVDKVPVGLVDSGKHWVLRFDTVYGQLGLALLLVQLCVLQVNKGMQLLTK